MLPFNTDSANEDVVPRINRQLLSVLRTLGQRRRSCCCLRSFVRSAGKIRRLFSSSLREIQFGNFCVVFTATKTERAEISGSDSTLYMRRRRRRRSKAKLWQFLTVHRASYVPTFASSFQHISSPFFSFAISLELDSWLVGSPAERRGGKSRRCRANERTEEKFVTTFQKTF